MKVIVAGAGIGGLACAIALHRRGHEVEVLEQASGPSEVGAGLAIWPNGSHVLEALGVQPESIRVDAFRILDRQGRLLAESPVDALEMRHGRPLLMIHRAELQGALLQALGADRVRFSCRVAGFAQDAAKVRVESSDGEREAELLVGADGLHSVVRRLLLFDGEPRYSGATCWRGVADFAIDGAFNWHGPGGEFGVFPLNRGRVYWFGVRNRPEREGDPAVGRRADVQSEFASWPTLVGDILEATPPDAILRNDLYDRRPVRRWSRGRVTLVGDAAHPMLPNAAQGACQALEDSVALAAALEGRPVSAALVAYEAGRRRRANSFVRQARQTARLVQSRNPALVGLRYFTFSHLPRSLMLRALDSTAPQQAGRATASS